MLEHPALIKRPVFDRDGTISVGFTDAVTHIWYLGILVVKRTSVQRNRELLITDRVDDGKRAYIAAQVFQFKVGDWFVALSDQDLPCRWSIVVRLIYQHLADAKVCDVLVEIRVRQFVASCAAALSGGRCWRRDWEHAAGWGVASSFINAKEIFSEIIDFISVLKNHVVDSV